VPVPAVAGSLRCHEVGGSSVKAMSGGSSLGLLTRGGYKRSGPSWFDRPDDSLALDRPSVETWFRSMPAGHRGPSQDSVFDPSNQERGAVDFVTGRARTPSMPRLSPGPMTIGARRRCDEWSCPRRLRHSVRWVNPTTIGAAIPELSESIPSPKPRSHVCPRCRGWLLPGGARGDADLACFTCGFVSYATPPLPILTTKNRERRPSRGGVPL
jgi:hypothetical protein